MPSSSILGQVQFKKFKNFKGLGLSHIQQFPVNGVCCMLQQINRRLRYFLSTRNGEGDAALPFGERPMLSLKLGTIRKKAYVVSAQLVIFQVKQNDPF